MDKAHFAHCDAVAGRRFDHLIVAERRHIDGAKPRSDSNDLRGLKFGLSDARMPLNDPLGARKLQMHLRCDGGSPSKNEKANS